MPDGSLSEELLADSKKVEVPESAVKLVMATIFFDELSNTISGPVFPYYVKSYGLPLQSIGWAVALNNVSTLLSSSYLNTMADHWGRRPVLLMSLFGAGSASLIQGLANPDLFGSFGYYIFLFGRIFGGIWCACTTTCNVYLTDVCPEEVRAGYLANLTALSLLTAMLGPGLGGLLANLGLCVPMLIDGCITIMAGCMVAYYLPETPAFLKRQQENKKLQTSPASGDAPQITSTSPISWQVYLVCFSELLSCMSVAITTSLTAVFMDERFHPFPAWKMGLCSMYMAGVMLLTSILVLGPIMQRMSTAAVSLMGLLIVSACVSVYPFNYSLPFAIIILGLYSVGGVLHGSVMASLLGDFANEDNRGKVFGIMQTFKKIGDITGPLIGTHLAQTVSMECPWLCSAAICTTGAVILYISRTYFFGPTVDAIAASNLQSVDEEN